MKRHATAITVILLAVLAGCATVPGPDPDYRRMAREAQGPAIAYELKTEPALTDQVLGIDDPDGVWSVKRFGLGAILGLIDVPGNETNPVPHTAHGSISDAIEIGPGSHSLVISGDFSLTFGSLVETSELDQTIILRVTGDASHSITFPATVLWSFAAAPAQPFPATLHTLIFKTVDGETIEGYEAGTDMGVVP
jgi:hypothetical protein